jgi:hypothetical protein
MYCLIFVTPGYVLRFRSLSATCGMEYLNALPIGFSELAVFRFFICSLFSYPKRTLLAAVPFLLTSILVANRRTFTSLRKNRKNQSRTVIRIRCDSVTLLRTLKLLASGWGANARDQDVQCRLAQTRNLKLFESIRLKRKENGVRSV